MSSSVHGEISAAKEARRPSLIGCFSGKYPGRKALHNLVDSWKVKCTVMPHKYDWFIFKFESEEEMSNVLFEGPYYFISGKPLLLQPMPEGFLSKEGDYSTVAVWVRLQSLPLQCWTTKALSRITSGVGIPVMQDRVTFEKKRISYARVLVEIDVSKPPLDSFPVKLPSGVQYEQKMVYEHAPKYCICCKRFGHYSLDCKEKEPNEDDGFKVVTPQKDKKESKAVGHTAKKGKKKGKGKGKGQRVKNVDGSLDCGGAPNPPPPVSS